MKLPLLVPVSLLLSLPLVGPAPALGQIASPSNAGQNSGNNASGSSSTTISSPSFTSITVVSTAPDVSVLPDGSVTAPQATVDSVNNAVVAAIGNVDSTGNLSAVVGAGESNATNDMSRQFGSSGAPQAEVDALIASLPGLASQPTLTGLSNAIDAFNALVNAATPEALARLAANSDFSAVQTLLRQARAAL